MKTMKNLDVITFHRGLKLAQFDYPSLTFVVTNNKRDAGEYIDRLKESNKPSKKHDEFSEKRKALAEKYCKKDEKGQIIYRTEPGLPGEVYQYFDIEGEFDKESDYYKELNALKETYSKEIKIQEDRDKKYQEGLLQEDSKFKVHKFSLKLLQKDKDGDKEKCPQWLMDLIFWMFEE